MLRVVSGVSLAAEPGQVTALLGANGAGKTTTIECAQGL
jgi:ABC-2 type transport system ATP-binding protein